MFHFHSHILATDTTKLRKQEPRAHKKKDDSVIEHLKMETGVKDAQLDTKVDMYIITRFFRKLHVKSPFELRLYLRSLGQSPDEQCTIRHPLLEALEIWRRTSAATYRALVGVTLDAHQAREAFRLCLHIKESVEPDTDRQLKSQGLFTMSIPYTYSTVPYLELIFVFILIYHHCCSL